MTLEINLVHNMNHKIKDELPQHLVKKKKKKVRILHLRNNGRDRVINWKPNHDLFKGFCTCVT